MHLPSTRIPYIPLARLCRNQSSKPYFTAETQSSQVNFAIRISGIRIFPTRRPFESSGKALRAELHRSLKQQNQNSNTLVLQHSISFLSPTSALNILCFHNMLSALLVSFSAIHGPRIFHVTDNAVCSDRSAPSFRIWPENCF